MEVDWEKEAMRRSKGGGRRARLEEEEMTDEEGYSGSERKIGFRFRIWFIS